MRGLREKKHRAERRWRQKDIPRTRQILRRLLVSRLECEAFDEGKRVGYRFKASGSYAALLPAGLATPWIANPRGIPLKDCVFCRIVARETPADIEYEDDAVLVFRDIYPKAPIHLLIVPKRHIASIATMDSKDTDVIGRCFLAARALGEAKGLAERGYRLRVNCGPEGGQVVYHVHVHFLAGGRERGS